MRATHCVQLCTAEKFANVKEIQGTKRNTFQGIQLDFFFYSSPKKQRVSGKNKTKQTKK